MITHSAVLSCQLRHAVPVPDPLTLVQFRVAALINDSVGTLAGGCYVDADTKIGVILGTGTNACYVEEARNVSALAGRNGHVQQRPYMAINTEWGNFDASSSPYTDVRPQTPASTTAEPGVCCSACCQKGFMSELAWT